MQSEDSVEVGVLEITGGDIIFGLVRTEESDALCQATAFFEGGDCSLEILLV